jgi:hypothetical protein
MSEIVNDLGATKEEDDQIVAYECGHCDFGTGRRGMDRCSKCDGTGSYLKFGGKKYENSRDGYKAALDAVRAAKVEPKP